MPATVAGIHLGPDTHANRPAANASGMPIGTLYVCTDHDLIYQSDGSAWTTWATLTGGLSNPMTTAGDIIVGGASGTPARLGIGSALRHLRVNSAGTALEYADPPAGGGGGTPRGKFQNSSGLTGLIDNFDDGSIGGGWTLVRDEARMTWSEKYGQIIAVRDTGVAGTGNRDLEAYLQSLTISTGDYIEAALETNYLESSTTFGAGIMLSDGVTFGSGTQIILWAYQVGNTSFWNQLESFTGFNTGGTRGTQHAVNFPHEARYVRLKYEAANTFGSYWSRDGVAWKTIQTNFSLTMTPTHAGIVVVHWDNPNTPAQAARWFYFGKNTPS